MDVCDLVKYPQDQGGLYPAHRKYQMPPWQLHKFSYFPYSCPIFGEVAFAIPVIRQSLEVDNKNVCLPFCIYPFHGKSVSERHLPIATSLPRSLTKILFCTLNATWAACFSYILLTCCVISFLCNIPHLEKSTGLSWAFSPGLSHWFLEQRKTICHFVATIIWRNKVLNELNIAPAALTDAFQVTQKTLH